MRSSVVERVRGRAAVGQDDERRQLTVRAGERRVGRRVVERVGGPARPSVGNSIGSGREIVAGSSVTVLARRRTPDTAQGRRVEPGHDGGIGRGAGQRDEAASAPTRSASSSVYGISSSPTRPSSATWKRWSGPAQPADRRDRAVGEEPVRRSIEDPGRVGELRLHRRQRLEPRALDDPVQVPPAAPVADQVERPVRRPLGLDDRLVRPARGQRRLAERAVGLDQRRRAGGSRPRACPGGPTRASTGACRRATGAARRRSRARTRAPPGRRRRAGRRRWC